MNSFHRVRVLPGGPLQPDRRPSVGFTLVELLVVIAIIGIMVSLLLPAVQASREAARRAMCTNQLQQLALAVHNYELAFETFPAGTVDAKGPIRNLPRGHHISWIARVLPYMEESAKFRHLDLSLSAYHKRNDAVRQLSIGTLICPSYPGSDGPVSCYAACHHDREAPIDTTNNGVFFLNSRITYDDLLDGAANTLLLGEKVPDGNTDLGWLSGTPATLRNTGQPVNQPVAKAAGGFGFGGWPWVNPPDYDELEYYGGESGGSLGAAEGDDAASQPDESDSNDTDDDTSDKPFLAHSQLGGDPAAPLSVGGFGSSHTFGANLALADGAVRFVAEHVSVGLLQRLANRQDGRLTSATEW